MSANFTPTLGGYKDLTGFRFWCQKVIPAVYDDSLSYYEVLCKLTNYINEVIENHNAMGADMLSLCEAYTMLQDYVNNYFASADVQAEINRKLDMMANDGTLSAVVGVYAKPLIDSQNAAILANGAAIEVLEQRMNSFTKLGEGNTTGDAEVIDIRTGATGAKFANAGEAVRNTFHFANNGAFKLVLTCDNTPLTIGKMLSGDNGGESTNACTAITKYVRAYAGEQISYDITGDVDGLELNLLVCEYADNEVSSFIKRTKVKPGTPLVLGSTTNYIRISLGRGLSTGINFTDDDTKYFVVNITNLYQRIADMFSQSLNSRYLATSDNSMNELTKFGVWGWTASNRPYDCPIGDGGVMLVVQYADTNNPEQGRLAQVIMSEYGIVSRYRTTTKWSSWKFSDRLTNYDSVKINALCSAASNQFVPYSDVDTTSVAVPVFEAGKHYTGLPYSSRHYDSLDAFINLTLETAFSMFNNKDSAVYHYENQSDVDTAVVYTGGVCSSFVSWACGLPIYYTTYDIAKMLNYKDVKCCEDLEIGDVIICNTTLGDASDHAAVVSNLIVGEDGVSAVEISEAWKPVFRKVVFTKEGFMELLNGVKREGDFYKVGRFDNHKIRTMPVFTINTDIITEFGDNTYFELGDDVYVQSTNESFTAYNPDGDACTINFAECPAKSGTNMRNIAGALNKLGTWTLCGANDEKSHVTLIKKGVITHSGNTFNMSGYEMCYPCGYCVVGIKEGGTGHYDTHLTDTKYKAHRLTVYSKDDPRYAGGLNGDSVTINTDGMSAKYVAYYVRVFYETGCGQAHLDSPIVWLD